MRVVVTGGAGFLGSHLCGTLLASGHDVVCVDDFSTSEASAVKALEQNPRFSLMVADVSTGLPVAGRVDAVAHLASPASPPEYRRLCLETLRVNSRGTEHALALAERSEALFLLASTSEVYGDPELHPQPEGYWGRVNPVGPRSMYDESKRFAEALATSYAAARGVEVRIARIFNTYGPGMRPGDGRVVPNFVAAALAGSPLVCFGDGSQTRSLCYVDDLVRGLVALLGSDVTGPVNLGNPEELSVLELAALVLELAGSSSTIEFAPLPGDDPRRRCPDIARARSLLGWAPRVSVRQGLARTIEWFAAGQPVAIAPAVARG